MPPTAEQSSSAVDLVELCLVERARPFGWASLTSLALSDLRADDEEAGRWRDAVCLDSTTTCEGVDKASEAFWIYAPQRLRLAVARRIAWRAARMAHDDTAGAAATPLDAWRFEASMEAHIAGWELLPWRRARLPAAAPRARRGRMRARARRHRSRRRTAGSRDGPDEPGPPAPPGADVGAGRRQARRAGGRA